MAARSKARKRALDILFAAEARSVSAGDLLDSQIDDGEAPTNDYTEALVRGVVADLPRIDELLSGYSEGWTLERMPAVDRNVLRLGVWELLHSDTPEPVVLSEAVALVQQLSTDESPVFVNGVLGAIARDKAHLGS